MMFEEYRDRVGELITGIVQQKDSRYTLVQLRERVEALLPKSEQVDGERYDHSQRIKAVIKEVSPSTKGPSIIVSRRDPELIKKLFELEVPEIADGLVEIANVAREPGYRSKIAVVSHADGVDPVGACVGPRGSRVRMVVSELRGEKIDIIPYNDEPARFVAKALSTRARARGARRRRRQAGDGHRARRPALAGDRPRGAERPPRRPPDRLADRHPLRDRVRRGGADGEGYEEEETAGAAPRSSPTGAAARTPRSPGSRYCGLDAHQALADDRRPTTSSRSRATPASAAEADEDARAERRCIDVWRALREARAAPLRARRRPGGRRSRRRRSPDRGAYVCIRPAVARTPSGARVPALHSGAPSSSTKDSPLESDS